MRSDLFQKTEEKSNFFQLELHVEKENKEENNKKYKFRVFIHEGEIESPKNEMNKEKKYFQEINTIEEAELLYSLIYIEKLNNKFKISHFLSSKIGSPHARKGISLFSTQEKSALLHSQVVQFVDYIFCESASSLSSLVKGQLTAEGTINTPLGKYIFFYFFI